MTSVLKHTRGTNNSGICFYKQIYNEYHCTKTAKMLDTQNCVQNHIKNAKATNFCQPSTLPKDKPAKFYFRTTLGLSFMVSSVAPTRSSISYA